jgi:hypothetical protein
MSLSATGSAGTNRRRALSQKLAVGSLAFLLCHPKPEAARLTITDELNSGLLEAG